jgi:hypothetical protein
MLKKKGWKRTREEEKGMRKWERKYAEEVQEKE